MTIKEAREAKGISRAQLSRELHIPIRTLESWDAGVRVPPKWVEEMVLARIAGLPGKDE